MFNALHAEEAKYADNEKDISETVIQGLDGTQLVQFKFKIKDHVSLGIPKERRGQLLNINREKLDTVTSEDPVNQRMLAIGADDPAFVEKVSELRKLFKNPRAKPDGTKMFCSAFLNDARMCCFFANAIVKY